MRSNKTSTMSEPKTLMLVDSKLSKTQVFATGDQTERSYGFQISIVDSKKVDTAENIHQCHTCDMTQIRKMLRGTLLTTDEE